MRGTTNPDGQKPLSGKFNSIVLVERLNAAQKACTDADGTINHDWLVMHIWLARCDSLRTAEMQAHHRDDYSGSKVKVRDGLADGQGKLFDEALVATLPFMSEFTSIVEFWMWRDAGRGAVVATDPDFLARAHEEGLPIDEDDLVYALGTDGPAGKAVFLGVAKRVTQAYFQ